MPENVTVLPYRRYQNMQFTSGSSIWKKHSNMQRHFIRENII